MRPKNSTTKNLPQNKKGQAALEYIVTYGWGFIVILVVLGGLAYFGYLNPTRYVPSRCSYGVQLECVDYKLEERIDGADNGTVTLVLRNNFGADINLTIIQLANGINPKSVDPINLKPITVVRGNSTTISYTLKGATPILIEKERISVPLIITFQRSIGGPLHNVTGEVFTTIQKRS